MKAFKKFIDGWIVQDFEKVDGEFACVSQIFQEVDADNSEPSYEDDEGGELESAPTYKHQPYDMVVPNGVKVDEKEEAMRSLLDSLNSYNQNFTVMAELLRKAHPTNQQSFMRFVVDMLKVIAEVREDGRNEQSVELAKKILAEFGGEIYLPMI